MAKKQTIQHSIPAGKANRNKLLLAVRDYVCHRRFVPPVPVAKLQRHAGNIVRRAGMDKRYIKFATVLLNNEIWVGAFCGIPFEKRLLLLPKCLRDNTSCPADIDEYGLVCKYCGKCVIEQLQKAAEKLGYVVLVAEGSPVVMSLVQSGEVSGMIGVSCMSVLEEMFPVVDAAAVPGIAIPLLRDGCVNTTVDFDWVWDAIHLHCEDEIQLLDLNAIRSEVISWFTEDALKKLMGTYRHESEAIAIEWLSRAGKRWRPFLTAAVYKAFDDKQCQNEAAMLSMQQVAVAMECFHKASLIHDDIEDDDSWRYGREALHKEYGVPVALNVGDLLLGEGYRLLTQCQISHKQKVSLLTAAAKGHKDLCLGQGIELCWLRNPVVLSVDEVLEIFRLKTAPAFQVALHCGAILAGVDTAVYYNTLNTYCESLGIAYQIRDDIDDFITGDNKHPRGLKPSLLVAMAYADADGDDKMMMRSSLYDQCSNERFANTNTNTNFGDKVGNSTNDNVIGENEKDNYEINTSKSMMIVKDIINKYNTIDKAEAILEEYKNKAISSLSPLDDINLKGLLRRIIARIFNDV